MKKVIVIGCNGDIGNAICASLKENGYFILGTDKKDVINKNIDDFFPADLGSTTQIMELCKNLKAKGKFWGIVFSSGIYPIKDFEDYPLELFEEVINVNLKSSFLIAQNIGPQITLRGRMIFISSGASYLGSKDIAYSISKGGLNGLAKGLAKHFSEKILVNIICPGIIDTKMSNRMGSIRKNKTIESTLLKRPGKPFELTEAVNFLLDEKNSYMTGATIDINGGLYFR